MKPITVTQLRNDAYNIIDKVIRTKESVIIKRGGEEIEISIKNSGPINPATQARDFSKVPKLNIQITGSLEDPTNWDWENNLVK